MSRDLDYDACINAPGRRRSPRLRRHIQRNRTSLVVPLLMALAGAWPAESHEDYTIWLDRRPVRSTVGSGRALDDLARSRVECASAPSSDLIGHALDYFEGPNGRVDCSPAVTGVDFERARARPGAPT